MLVEENVDIPQLQNLTLQTFTIGILARIFSLDLHLDSHTKTVSCQTGHSPSLGGWIPTGASVVSANEANDIISRLSLSVTHFTAVA